MDDRKVLTDLNDRFIDAFRTGSWARLEPILSPEFSYLDGATGDIWPMERYIASLDGNPRPSLDFDQVRIHVDGDTAVVSARTFTGTDRSSRYVDTYERRDGGWLCVHACVWPLVEARS
ncbi:MAG: nuclear transport factor 2 family protein [Acidimicrobiales bacterium]